MENITGKKVLLTGAAGFIGYHLEKELLSNGYIVAGVDNLNDYYDKNLKTARLDDLKAHPNGRNFSFYKESISNYDNLKEIFFDFRPDIVINLAAQAGVRYSIDHPRDYIDSNIVGFFNILELCRRLTEEGSPVDHLIFASSSSVYGGNDKTPFCESDQVDKPQSLYAATKKSDELMAFCYNHLYKTRMTGLRFFTVYGPYGRPDMAYYSFTQKMIKGDAIKVFNNGDLYRDFTYISDIIAGIMTVLTAPATYQYKIFNIGGKHCTSLMDFIKTLEDALIEEGLTHDRAKKEFLPMQKGDVLITKADTSELEKLGWLPKVTLKEGLTLFSHWYKDYYKI